MSFLLDTNVVSEARKVVPDPAVEAWLASVRATDLYVSVLVIGEIRQGVERLRRRDHRRAGTYEAWLDTLLRHYGDRILPLTVEAAQQWGRWNVPDRLPAVDGLIAATAMVHDLTLVTGNARDFRRPGLRVLDPFQRH